MLVSAVRGGPDSLVSGEQAGTNYWLSRGDGCCAPSRRPRRRCSDADELRRLARLARQARGVFGGPQDIEFGFDASGRLWLFQSRPITAMAARPARGARLLGPGAGRGDAAGSTGAAGRGLVGGPDGPWAGRRARHRGHRAPAAAALGSGGHRGRRTGRGGPAAARRRTAPDRWLALLNPAPGARRLGRRLAGGPADGGAARSRRGPRRGRRPPARRDPAPGPAHPAPTWSPNSAGPVPSWSPCTPRRPSRAPSCPSPARTAAGTALDRPRGDPRPRRTGRPDGGGAAGGAGPGARQVCAGS
jgi:hypothetical protein